jgi:type IV secretion system protein VirB6
MEKKVNNFCFQIIAFVITLFVPCLSFAGYNGNSCVSYTNANVDTDYLQQNTAYGYVLSNLDMQPSGLSNNCDPSDKEIKICIKNSSGACVFYTFSKDTEVPVTSLTSDKLNIDQLSSFRIKTKIISPENYLCLTMDTIYGEMPLVCKNTPSSLTPPPPRPTNTCTKSQACNFSATSQHSQLLLNFSGRTIQCVRESLEDIFFNDNLCPAHKNLNKFSVVVDYLRKAIFAALIIYTIFYGIKVLTDPYRVNMEEALMFVVKMLMVIYFTVGFQFSSIFAGQVTQKTENGMVDIALPLLTSLSSDLSQIVFSAAKTNSSSVGLCEFDVNSYQNGYSYYALFDMIDCRVGYFLGYGLLYDSFKNASANSKEFPRNGFLAFKVITGMLLSSPILAIVNVIFIYLFLYTLIVRFVGIYIVYFISLYAMIFISPIFIPMALFKQTKSMFQGWMKVTLSFALQPAIIASFMTIMLAIYDQALYGDCGFSRHTYSNTGGTITTFEINNPPGATKCSNSYGYQMYRMFAGDNWSKKNFTLFQFDVVMPDVQYLGAALQALIISYIIYKFAINAQQFAAELTGGVSIDLAAGLEKMKEKTKTKEGGDDAKDKSKQGDEAKDKASSGDGGATDKASSGGADKAGGGGAADKAGSGGLGK